MRVELSQAQLRIQQRFGELIDESLIPVIRRMSRNPHTDPGNEPAELAEAAAQTRRAVWQALVDLGAIRLLLPAAHGGEGAGQQGAVMLAELLGRALYDGPLLDTMIAVELLGLLPATELREELAGGAAVCLASRQAGSDHPGRPGPLPPPGATVTADRRFVNAAADCDYLLLVGRSGAELGAAMTVRNDPAVQLRRQREVTRSQLYAVRWQSAPVLWSAGRITEPWRSVLAQARIRHAAYLVGLTQGALDLTLERCRERTQFGQPIGRYQAPALRLAELATRLEAARWLVRAAAWHADTGRDPRLAAAQALGMAADLAGEVVLASVHLHGAFGLLEDSDVQLYLCRAQLDRVWLGAASEVRAEAFPLLLEESMRRRRTEVVGV
jgi:alkylation response protein AidB-like acyl-CoA dehydrogenase